MRKLLVLAGLAVAAAGQESEFDKGLRAFQALRAQEKVRIAEYKAAQDEVEAAEKALERAGRRAIASANTDTRALGTIEDLTRAKYDERLKVSVDVAALRTEAALLRKWFDEVTEGKTTIPVALRLAGMQLARLGKDAVIEPRKTSFRTIHELRNYLADVKRRLGAAVTREAERKQGLDEELKRLKELWAQALGYVASGVRVPDQTQQAWMEALVRVDGKRLALEKTRRELMAAFGRLQRIAYHHSPPIVEFVRVTAGNTIVYEAKWRPDKELGDRMKVDERIRATERKITKVRAELESIRNGWLELGRSRVDLCRRMHGMSKRLEAYAAEYGTAIYNKALAAVVVDATVAAVGIVVTGGAAVLAAKALEAKLASKTKLADAMGGMVPDRMYNKLLASGAPRTLDPAKRLAQAQFRSGILLKEYVKAAEKAAARRGADVYKASRRAQLEAHAVLDRVDLTLPLREQQKRLEALVKLAKYAATPPQGMRAVGGLTRAGFHELLSGDGLPREKSVNAESARIVLGDAIGTSMTAVGGAYAAQRLATPDLSRWAALRQAVKWDGLKRMLKGGGGLNLALGVVGTGVKVYLDREFQAQANQAIGKFWVLYAQTSCLYTVYRTLLLTDVQFQRTLNATRAQLALLQRDRLELRSPYKIVRRDCPYAWDPDSVLTIRIHLSNLVSRPPVVRLGNVAVPMQARGDPRTARGWQGTVPAKSFADGEAALVVALAPDTKPWAELDSNPATRAHLIQAVLNVWKGYERGADKEHHAVAFDFEIAKAIAALRSYDALLKEHASRGQVLYGSGSRTSGTGWGGMDKSVRAAHERVKAPAQGDPHGTWWLAGCKFSLHHSAVLQLRGPRNRFVQHLRSLAAAGKKMTARERTYQQKAIAALYFWSKTRKSWYAAAQLWLERKALYGVIGKVKDPVRRKALTEQNKAAIAKIEKQLRELGKALPEFEK